ncbi:PcfU [Enterococcus saccharolyticus]|uniref:PcfU n=1 Tax=Enterococcus saccharolyticus TaxID=41997 RepID=UPI0039E1457E
MNEQLSFFDDTSIGYVSFCGYYCNDEWTPKTKRVDEVTDIVEWFHITLTKTELKKICRQAVLISRDGPYGYSVYFVDDGIKKEIFVRFNNFTTSNHLSVFEHIDLFFDRCVE